MEHPKISVIMPIYKAEKYLDICVTSILQQTFRDFELLLIDDGSPDGCGRMCDEYAERDSRVKVFHKPNGGVSSARNLGIEAATGEWIYFPDSDDELYPDAFATLTKHTEDDIAYVMAGYTLHDETGNKTYEISTRKEIFISNCDATSQMFEPQDYLYHGYLWNKLFRSSIIKAAKLRFEEKIYFNEDRLFNVLYLLNIGKQKCYYTTTPVYKYIERPGSAMASLKTAYNPKFATDLTAFMHMLEALKAKGDQRNIKLCKKASYWSYNWNISLMKQFNSYDKELDRQMYEELRKHLSLSYITYIRLRNILGRIKYRIFKLIK